MFESLYGLWAIMESGLSGFYDLMAQKLSVLVPGWLQTIFNIFSFGLWDSVKDYSLIVVMFGAGLIVFLGVTLVQWILKAVPVA